MSKVENLKVGDKVIVSGLYRYDRISQVERVTNKYIFVESVKFSKASGYYHGAEIPQRISNQPRKKI